MPRRGRACRPATLTLPAPLAARVLCSGGPRKCVGDQFALMEGVVVLATLLKQYDFELVPGREPGMTTGATIHTSNGLYMYVKRRAGAAAGTAAQPAAALA